MITGEQIKAARKLLGWPAATLAKRAGKTLLAVDRAEQNKVPVNHFKVIPDIRAALETAGVEFIPENGDGAGVRLRKPCPKKADDGNPEGHVPFDLGGKSDPL